MDEDRDPTDLDSAAPAQSTRPPPAEPAPSAEPEPIAEPDVAAGEAPIVAWSAPSADAREPWQLDLPPGATGLDVVSVFGRTIDTFLGHWPTFVALTIPVALATLASTVAVRPFVASQAREPADFIGLLSYPVSIYVTTAIAMAADDARAGRRVSALAVLWPAVLRSIIALVSAAVAFICVVGLALVPVAVAGFVGIGGRPNVAAGLLALLLVLIVFGVIFYVLFRWCLAPIAIAIDRAGPLAALTRSWRLTKGHLWRLGVLVIGITLLTAPWLIAGSLFVFGDSIQVGAAIGVLGTLIFGALGSIVVTLAYGDITGRPRADPAPDLEPVAEPAIAPTDEPLAAGPVLALAADPEPTPAETLPAGPVPGSLPASPGPSRRSRLARRAYVLGILVIGCVLLVPSVVAAGPEFGNLGFANVPLEDRGKIVAGTERNAADPCSPLQRATTFASSDTIYVGGYFSRAILPGQSATVHVLVDDDELAAVPISAQTQLVGCYYEQNGLSGLSPAEYHLVIDDAIGVLAEGSFIVR